MRITSSCRRACVAAAVFATLAGTALAQPSQEPTCGKFQLVRHADHVSFIDQGDTGASPGDRRVLRWQIKTKEGEPVASQYSTSTVMPAEPDGSNLVMADSVITFDIGTLRVSVLAPLSNPSDTRRSSDIELEWTVLGGTGDFRHATGTVKTIPLGNGTYDIVFDLSCPTP